MSSRGWFRFVAVAALLLVLGFSAGLVASRARPAAETPSSQPLVALPVQLNAPASTTAPTGRALLEQLQDAFHHAAAAVTPAVVQVNSIRTVRVRSPFSRSAREVTRAGGTGSAVIVAQRGKVYLAVTNDEVVARATELVITLGDGSEVSGEVTRRDAARNLAVIEFAPQRALTIATLGDSDTLAVGDWVLAIGSPFGFQSSVTAGIVSAIATAEPHSGLIQTDAAINPGNSGGPLVNLDGHVIGINTWLASQNSIGGIGFALPINEVKLLLALSI
jgi:serine protease Do